MSLRNSRRGGNSPRDSEVFPPSNFSVLGGAGGKKGEGGGGGGVVCWLVDWMRSTDRSMPLLFKSTPHNPIPFGSTLIVDRSKP